MLTEGWQAEEVGLEEEVGLDKTFESGKLFSSVCRRSNLVLEKLCFCSS